MAETLLNDLFRLDTKALQWVLLSNSTHNAAPSPRCAGGFVAVNGRLFVFAGQNAAGSCAA